MELDGYLAIDDDFVIERQRTGSQFRRLGKEADRCRHDQRRFRRLVGRIPGSLFWRNLDQRRSELDLIAVGRALLSDPWWVAKVRANDQANLKGFSPTAMAELA